MNCHTIEYQFCLKKGYTITISRCPLLCSSKLQIEIALSTTETKYGALSQSMHDLIPLTSILLELSKVTYLNQESSKTYCAVFEDGSGALE